MSDTEKLPVDHVDSVDAASSHGFSPEEQKNIIRRIDRRLVVTVGFMYCVSLMDRTNMGATIIAGMGEDLMLIKNRYVSCYFSPLTQYLEQVS